MDLLARQTGWQTCNQGENGRVIPVSAPAFPADTGYLVVMLGTNDLLQGRSPAAVTAGMERFLSGVALARGRILLIAPPPVREGAWVREKGVIDGARALGAMLSRPGRAPGRSLCRRRGMAHRPGR